MATLNNVVVPDTEAGVLSSLLAQRNAVRLRHGKPALTASVVAGILLTELARKPRLMRRLFIIRP